MEYDVPDRDGNGTGELIVLLTTILDPADTDADELAAGYHQRREEETGNDQLKTPPARTGEILRSRLPGWSTRRDLGVAAGPPRPIALITRAADAADLDPDRVSFVRALRIARHTATGTACFPLRAGTTS